MHWRFIDRCKQNSQYKNTVFYILADHDEAMDPGDNECKIYHIPLLILNSKHGVEPTVLLLRSAIIPSTILGEIGYHSKQHFVGQDIFSAGHHPFAFMRSYSNVVYLLPRQFYA